MVKLKKYLKIPSFKIGDTIKIIDKHQTGVTFLKRLSGKEFVVDGIGADGKLTLNSYTANNIYIIDIQTI